MNKLLYIIASVLLLLGAIGVAVFLVWPRYQEFMLLRSEVKERQERLESGELALLQLRKTKEQVLAHAEEFEKLSLGLPEDPAIPALYDHIQQLGLNSGLALVSISGAQAPERLEEVTVLTFHTEWRGSYEQLKNFLDTLRRSARILNIGQITVAANPDNPEDMGINVEISAYAIEP